jgi:hypothetical protein
LNRLRPRHDAANPGRIFQGHHGADINSVPYRGGVQAISTCSAIAST